MNVLHIQEMLDIMKAIYDMMGKSVSPRLSEDVPRQHTEIFFQVMSFCNMMLWADSYDLILCNCVVLFIDFN